MSQMFPCLDMHNCRNNNRCKFAKIHNITFYFLFTFDKTILQLSCCEKKYKVGCYPHCGIAVMPFTALQTGTHILEVEYLGNIYLYEIEATLDSYFEIDLSLFNENALFSFRIKQTNNTYYTTEIGGVEYSCFEMKTKVLMTAPITLEVCERDYVMCDYWEDDYAD